MSNDGKNSAKPIFILGLGAQKSGTSWLHHTLSKNPNVNLGFLKEYHIWDYLLSDLSAGFEATVGKPDRPSRALRRMMQQDIKVYISYFQGLLDATVTVTGDITPSYGVIDSKGLQQISTTLDAAGFDVKVVVLLRDPIERLWSATRMQKRDKERRGQQLQDDFCNFRIREFLMSRDRQQATRSDYKTLVESISRVFEKEKVYYGLYETLFDRESTERLSNFLGFEIRHANFSEFINQSPDEPLNKELEKLLLSHFASQYEFCNDRFPETIRVWNRPQ